MQGMIDNQEEQGIVPRMVKSVFERIQQASESIEFTVKVSMLEIYCENLKDLLNPIKDKMIIKQDPIKGIFIPDLTEKYISEANDIYKIMAEGNHNRATAATLMNAHSS